MKIITYSLYNGEKNSNSYYQDAASFSDIVLNKGLQITMPWIEKVKAYIEKNKIENVRSNEEYMLEILTLGVLWLCYSDDAARLEKIPKEFLTELVEVRQKGGKLKLGADYLRGILGTLILYSEHRSDIVSQIQFNMENFIKLIDWLSATGEFIQETRRLKVWQSYLGTIGEKDTSDFIALSVFFAMWFEQQSLSALGKYTEGVEPFLEKVKEKYKWREDLIFCSRQRVEYHLNMAGAEIMNRAYKSDFIKTKRKAVFLPACIRKNLDGKCKARVNKDIMCCSSCDSQCQVNKIKALGKKYDYEVFIIPHESAAFSDKTINVGELGIIGIACITNLLAGGWKAKALGIPAQCIMLDYCGCKNHWDDEGFSTSINMDQLEKLMNNNLEIEKK